MDFSFALALLKQGYRVSRKGWNGPRQFLFMAEGLPAQVLSSPPSAGHFGNVSTSGAASVGYRLVRLAPHILLSMTDGAFVAWTPGQADIMAEDWQQEPYGA